MTYYAKQTIKALSLAVLFGALMVVFAIVWGSITLSIWHNYGDNTFIWWLVSNALIMAFILVALW